MVFKRIIIISLLLISYITVWGQKDKDQVLGKKLEHIKLVDPSNNASVDLYDFDKVNNWVVIFYSAECPFVKVYQPRLMQLMQAHQGSDVEFVYIYAASTIDNVQVENINAIVKSHNQKKLHFLVDKNQQLQQALHATKTPEVFVLKKVQSNLVVHYMGAIDNSPKANSEPTETYLEDALQSLFKHTALKISAKSPLGCSIN